MNNLPFGTAPYQQFKTTFLASVIVGINYDNVQKTEMRESKWKNFASELFSIQPLEDIFKKPIFVGRNDQKLAYYFDKDRAQVQISGDGYQNYGDSVIPHAYKLKQFVTEVAGVSNPRQLDIRKIDVFQIETNNSKMPEESEVRQHFFSRNYCNLADSKAILDEKEKLISGMMKHQWIEDCNVFTLRSAFVKDSKISNRYRLILDIEEKYTPQEGVNLDKLDVKLKEMNMDLFNAFVWCVSEGVLNIMKNGKV